MADTWEAWVLLGCGHWLYQTTNGRPSVGVFGVCGGGLPKCDRPYVERVFARPRYRLGANAPVEVMPVRRG